MADDWDEGGDDYDQQQEEEPQQATVQFQVRVLYPFESSCDVELNIKRGDIINVLRTDVGGGWWEGELNGSLGLFPEKYTEMIQQEAEPAAAAAPAASSASSSASHAPQPTPRPTASVSTSHTSSSTSASTSALPAHASPGAVAAGSGAGGAPSSLPRVMSRNPMDPGPRWSSPGDPMRITVRTGAKGSKFSGIKQFTTYDIRNENTGTVVSRRFKHFGWLHARLAGQFPCIVLPPIPEKQLQGRFDEMFVEHRRRKLQRFITRVAQHPVLGTSSVFLHFLSASDKKTWKTGKRTAESEATSAFLAQIVTPADRPADTDTILANFMRFFAWFDRQLHHLGKVLDELSTHQQAEAGEYGRCTAVLQRFNDTIAPTAKVDKADIRPKYGEWWTPEAPSAAVADLMTAMGQLGDGLSRAAALGSNFQDQERQVMYDLVREYIGIMKCFGSIVKTHDSAWHDYSSASMNEKVTPEQREAMRTRCNAMSCVVLCEFRHFHEYAVADFREALRTFARNRVEHYRQAQELWLSIAESVE